MTTTEIRKMANAFATLLKDKVESGMEEPRRFAILRQRSPRPTARTWRTPLKGSCKRKSRAA